MSSIDIHKVFRHSFPQSLIAVLVYCAVLSAANANELKHPDWHPSGNFLIAEGSCAGDIDLYVIDVRNNRIRLVLDSDFTDGYPRWFPDGRRLAFHRIDQDRISRIFVAELPEDGQVSSEKPLTDGPFDIEPSPSPDGTGIAYSRQGENGQDIAILNLQNPVRNRVWKTPDPENFPSWHPAGRSIIFHAAGATDTQIFARDLQSDRLDELMKSGGPNIVGHYGEQGKMIAYSSERTGDREIYIYDVETGADMRLTNRPGRDGYPKLSPDGRTIAYHSVISEASTKVVVSDLEGRKIAQYSCNHWTKSR